MEEQLPSEEKKTGLGLELLSRLPTTRGKKSSKNLGTNNHQMGDTEEPRTTSSSHTSPEELAGSVPSPAAVGVMLGSADGYHHHHYYQCGAAGAGPVNHYHFYGPVVPSHVPPTTPIMPPGVPVAAPQQPPVTVSGTSGLLSPRYQHTVSSTGSNSPSTSLGRNVLEEEEEILGARGRAARHGSPTTQQQTSQQNQSQHEEHTHRPKADSTPEITSSQTPPAIVPADRTLSPHSSHQRGHGLSANKKKDWRSTEFLESAADVGRTNTGEQLVRLNVGGTLITTTKTTLLSKGENFFTPLLSGKIPTQRDDSGAYFIDRSGRYFEPILNFMRYGQLIIPPDIPLQSVLHEANFYSIDIIPGMCGSIKEGLYTSSNWIIYLERDPHHPWIFGLTGVEDNRKKVNKIVFFKRVCRVLDTAIKFDCNDVLYEIYSVDGNVYIWNPASFGSQSQLFFRCPNSTAFPLDVADLLESDIQVQGEPLSISFKANPKGEVTAKTEHPSNAVEPCTYYVEVMCRRLLLMHTTSNQSKQSADDYVLGVTQTSSTMTNVISVDGTVDKSTKTSTHWLLYLHSESSYFSFGQPFLDFGSSWHKRKK